jgi:hypothetical protein
MEVILDAEPGTEKLNDKAHDLVQKAINGILGALTKTLSGRSDELGTSADSLALNILVGSLFGIVQGNIPQQYQEEFVQLVANALRNNFAHYNEWIKTNGDKD